MNHPSLAMPPAVPPRTALPGPTSPSHPLRAAASALRQPLRPGLILYHAAVILGLFLLNRLGTSGQIAFFVVAAGMVVYSPAAAYKALGIASVALFLNTAIVPKTAVWTVGRLLLPMLVLLRFSVDMMALRRSLFTSGWYIALVCYCLTMALCSIASGWYTQIALLKVVMFFVSVSAVFSGVAVLRARAIDLRDWYMGLILATSLVGVGSVVLGFGNYYFRVGRMVMSFVGAFCHPNCHALYAVMFVAFLGSLLVFSSCRHRYLTLPLMAAWAYFMVRSHSRTSVAATAFTIATLVIVAGRFRGRHGLVLNVNIGRPVLVAAVLLATALVAAYDAATDGSLAESAAEFAYKGRKLGNIDTEGVDTEALLYSRMGRIDQSFTNFLDSPVFGIGFGVAKTQAFVNMATLFTAPAEKGFLPTAVLEEGGVLGATAFVVFLATLVFSLVREANAPGIVSLAAIIASNCGEMTLFATTGMGLFCWVALGMGIMLGDTCLQRQPARRFEAPQVPFPTTVRRHAPLAVPSAAKVPA